MLKIDKGVKIPPTEKGKGRGKYPWGEMKVGDSFLVPLKPDGSRPNTAFTKWAKTKYGYQLTMRTTDEGVRIWRVK